jgi:hypothetical protein
MLAWLRRRVSLWQTERQPTFATDAPETADLVAGGPVNLVNLVKVGGNRWIR